ncbi:hypothetical protein NL676_027293 [Syzygium grande]|nr:hypothetical protein NL676_027293 [Syzygium grande]
MARSLAAPRCLRRLFSTSSFFPPPAAAAAESRVEPEPNTNLFVSGLSKRTTTEKLREAFSQFGEVIHARVVSDRISGYSKGFGFVRYATLEDAAKEFSSFSCSGCCNRVFFYGRGSNKEKFCNSGCRTVPKKWITAKRANRTRRKRPNRLMGQEISSEMSLFVQCMWRAMQE